jgi:hypothetical protein
VGKKVVPILHFFILILEILNLRRYKNEVKHIWLHTNVKLDEEIEIISV